MNKRKDLSPKRNGYKGSIWSIALSFIALIGAGVAIAVAAPRTQDLSFDYYGVIVGILSLLVTAVVGWNIYTIIDLKEIKQDLSVYRQEYNLKESQNNAQHYDAISNVFYALSRGEKPLSYFEQCIYNRVNAIFYAYQSGRLELCDAYMRMILELIPSPDKIEVSEVVKTSMVKLLALITPSKQIPLYKDVYRKIENLKVRVSSLAR